MNVFLFRRGGRYALLDCGLRSEDSLLALEAALRHLGAGWDSITEILVSHLHPDHVGAAAEIRRRSGAPVRMPPLESRLVRPLGPNQPFFGETTAFLRQNGVPSAHIEAMRRSASAGRSSFERLIVDGPLDEGERIGFDGGTLVAITASGHSPALLCFYCPEQSVLFSTDAILPRVTPNIGVHWFYDEDPLGDYMQSLAKLERLEAQTIVPSHGRPFEGHREWIDSARTHHARRCETILATLGDHPLDAYCIAGTVWGEDRSLVERRFAMSESLSHLKYMALSHRVETVRIKGIAHWRPA